MKRARGSAKKYVESSESEDDRPLKRSSPSEERKNNPEDSSSSESDIENYLQNPEKLDLDSEFFNTKAVTEFESIEKNIFSGVRRLSDSESDTNEEEQPSEIKEPPKDHGQTSTQEKTENNIPSSRLTFNQLENYTKQIEEAKRQVEIYKAKKQAQENKIDISNLLATGESKTGMEQSLTPADLHSSDFESCDSEQEDWEEIQNKTSQENDKNLIPAKGLQIIVDMPDNVRKKKGIDLVAAMKRRLNRIRKENQVLVHKVHLLCWIAHGNYVNSAINDTETMAMALSLLPSEQSYPSDRPDLSYLEKITAWYKRTVTNIEKPVPQDMPLEKCLQHQITKKEAYDKKMLAIIFIIILRSLGIQARVVMSLQVEPLRPPASELHSVSTKESKHKKSSSAASVKGSASTQSKKKTSAQIGSVSNKASTSGMSSTKTETKTNIKINIQKPSPDKVKKAISDVEIEDTTKRRSTAKKTTTNLDNKRKNLESSETEKKVRSKSAETRSSKVSKKDTKPKIEAAKNIRRSKSTESGNSTTSRKTQKDKDEKAALKPDNTTSRKRAKSTECLDSVPIPHSGKTRQTGNLKATEEKSRNQAELKPDDPKTRKRAKSAGSVDSVSKPNSRKSKQTSNLKGTGESSKNQAGLKPEDPKPRKRAKSTESVDSVQSTSSRRSTRSTHSKQSQGSNLEVPEDPKPRKRAKSTESVDSVESTSNRRSTRNSQSKQSQESNLEATKPRKRAKSTESVDSLQSTSSRRSTRSTQSKQSQESNLKVPASRKRTASTESKESTTSIKISTSRSRSADHKKRTTKSKVIAQVDGLYDSDSDVELIILQVDGANDKQQPKTKTKPNLKSLKKPPSTPIAKKTIVKPNLKSLVNKKVASKKMDTSDSESDFEPAGGSPFKQRLEKAAPDLKKLKIIKRQGAKQVDVTRDIVSLVKGRMSEQKRMDRSRLVKKRKPDPASNSDSDYAPEPIKKKHHDSEDDFVPKTKVKRRVQVHPVLSDTESEKKTKKGNDVWVEVFLEAEEKWITVDVVYGQVHCIKELSQRATRPISYVLAWDNNNNIKDVTQRYCPNFNTVTRKLRIGQTWWTNSLKPFMGIPTARDKEEDEDLARQQLDQPLPKAISEYKDHPLYALRRHLLKFQAIYPPEPATLGFIRGEAVYPRSCVYTLHSRDIWLKQAKVVKLGEKPYKIVKARPKWDKLSNKAITDQLLEIFGPWQVQDYEPPTAENGIVPKNAFGNVDLFKPCMLPKGCVHLKLPGLNKITRRMNIDCASAIIGFDFHGGWSHPVYDGFIVCKEYEDQLICAWELEQDEIERKEQEKIDKRVYGNWKKLIRGLLIRERLKAKYDFGGPSTASTSHDKKAKAPTFCTKK